MENKPTTLCSYCRTNPATSVDHVVPRKKDENLTSQNTTPACTHCNFSKRDHVAPKSSPSGYSGEWPRSGGQTSCPFGSRASSCDH
ncbi:HNH endonuclease [Haloechinothrix halophila]|uniref:HNH endonuclease n=1 Tax=Haloechinothrix halophila TaxID=1069073 RepID=UPI0009FD2229